MVNYYLRPYGYIENTPSVDEELLDNLGAELVSQNGYNNILSAELYAPLETAMTLCTEPLVLMIKYLPTLQKLVLNFGLLPIKSSHF